ncbi:MAG: hypothetical protein MZW92_45520 [Comamonadaceae bacterium]|nr:hypothetical protein [Comamonadaceae bacterium]
MRWPRPCEPRESRHERSATRQRRRDALRRARSALRIAAGLTERAADAAARRRRTPALRPRAGAGRAPAGSRRRRPRPAIVVGTAPASPRCGASDRWWQRLGVAAAAAGAGWPAWSLIQRARTHEQVLRRRRDRHRAAGRRPAAGGLRRPGLRRVPASAPQP